MISALKMIAEAIAEFALCRCMMLIFSSPGKTPANIAGMIAKYFATSFAIEKVVSAPRVMSSCLPTSTISISFVGFESRSTMLPASFADVGLGQCGSVVGAVAGHRDHATAGLLLLDQRHLRLRGRLREEVVDTCLLGDHRGRHPVVAGDHDGADAH